VVQCSGGLCDGPAVGDFTALWTLFWRRAQIIAAVDAATLASPVGLALRSDRGETKPQQRKRAEQNGGD
jgi:hypothetical protein